MESNRKNRKAEVGNTNQPPQLKSWFFTFNNYEQNDIVILERYFNTICTKYIFQEETGESGTPHLQGSIHLKKSMRFSQFNLSTKIHWEKTRNNDKADEYACKSESRTGKIFSKGMPTPIEIITEFKPWQKNILDIVSQKPEKRKVYWFWENIGNVGKTDIVKYLVVTQNALFCNGGKYSDICNLVFKNDMDKCRIMIFDLPRKHGGMISTDAIEAIKNGMICNTKYETGCKVFNWPHVLIFANAPPNDLDDLSLDKWIITEIK